MFETRISCTLAGRLCEQFPHGHLLPLNFVQYCHTTCIGVVSPLVSKLGKPSRGKSDVFLNIVQTGGGGGVNPCSKILSEIVVRSGGHLTT